MNPKKWAERLPHWGPHEHAGVTQSLGHLDPFRYFMILPAKAADATRPARPAKEVEIRAAFSCHVFTRFPVPADGPEHRYRLSKEGRCFCPVRYGLSHLLPDIVRTLDRRNCYPANQENFLVIDTPALLAGGSEYRVFFDLRSTGEAGALLAYIESAYPIQKGAGPAGVQAQPIGFRVLVSRELAKQNRAV
jgi:hypothetical protein